MAITRHAQDKEGLDIDDAGGREDVFCLDDTVDRVSNGVKDLLRDFASCRSDQAHRIDQNGGWVRSGEEFCFRDDGKDRRNIRKVCV